MCRGGVPDAPDLRGAQRYAPSPSGLSAIHLSQRERQVKEGKAPHSAPPLGELAFAKQMTERVTGGKTTAPARPIGTGRVEVKMYEAGG